MQYPSWLEGLGRGRAAQEILASMKRGHDFTGNEKGSKRHAIDQGPWWIKFVLPPQAPGSLIGRAGLEMKHLEIAQNYGR